MKYQALGKFRGFFFHAPICSACNDLYDLYLGLKLKFLFQQIIIYTKKPAEFKPAG